MVNVWRDGESPTSEVISPRHTHRSVRMYLRLYGAMRVLVTILDVI